MNVDRLLACGKFFFLILCLQVMVIRYAMPVGSNSFYWRIIAMDKDSRPQKCGALGCMEYATRRSRFCSEHREIFIAWKRWFREQNEKFAREHTQQTLLDDEFFDQIELMR
jgi:hypothetical protein